MREVNAVIITIKYRYEACVCVVFDRHVSRARLTVILIIHEL